MAWAGTVAVQEVGRDEGGRRAEHDLGAHLYEAPEVGARDPGVEQVAHYDDLCAADVSQVTLDGVQVQKGLGGMGVGAVAAVDYAGVEESGHEVRRAGVGVADDDDVGVHGLDGEGGVVEGLALFDAAAPAGHVDDVSAKYLAGLLERDAGAGAGLVE